MYSQPVGFELRGYQSALLDKVRMSIAAGNRKILVVLPTGGGKTVVAAQIVKSAADKGNITMFLAHRRELIYQCADKLTRFGVDHGILMAGEYPTGAADAQVASVDTIRSRCITSNKLPMPYADICFIDEAHRSLAPTYLKLIDHYADRVVIGLTATPIRSDGKGLGHVYDDLVLGPTIRELIDLGHLAVPKTFAPTIPDLTGIRVRRGDYDERELAKAMDKRSLVGDIVTHWWRLAEGRPTIVFASSVQHSIHLRDEFVKQGVKAEHIDGTTNAYHRERIIKELGNGKTQVVCNYGVLTEGFDEPKLSACVLARPTKNMGLYLQMAGRVLRTAPGKEDALIIDHSGNVYEHGFVEDPQPWVLEEGKALETSAKERQSKMAEKKTITCVKCAYVYSGQLRCPECGHEPEKKGRYVESRSGELGQVTATKRRSAKKREYTGDEMIAWHQSLILIGEKRGYKKAHGWAAHKFKKKFGHWPPPAVPWRMSEPLPEVASWVRAMDIRYAKAKEKERDGEKRDEGSGEG